MRRQKTWLRYQKGQERLTGLALLDAHRDWPIIEVGVNKVIDRFGKTEKTEIVIKLRNYQFDK